MEQSRFERYAIFQSGGKQYQAIEGKTVALEKLDAEVGQEVQFPEVLLRKTDADTIVVGRPFVAHPVRATVIKHDRDKKITVFKFKRRKAYSVKQGHRQPLTVVRIEAI